MGNHNSFVICYNQCRRHKAQRPRRETNKKVVMKTITNRFVSSLDSGKITDNGNGNLTFNNGLVLNSGQPMRDGLRYDIESLDLDDYNGKLFASHEYDNLSSMLGVLEGIEKRDGQLVANGVQFAMSNPQGELAYEMTKEGFIDEVSIGTMGFPANEEGVYENHSVYETSLVLVPNDPRAVVNSPLMVAVANGMDISPFMDTQKAPEKVTNNSKDKEKTVTKDKTVKNDAPVDAPAEEAPATPAVDTPSVEEQVNSAVEKALSKFAETIEASTHAGPTVERTTDVAPSVVSTRKTDEIKNMTDNDRLREQIIITSKRQITSADADKLQAINEFHVEQTLKSDKIDDMFKQSIGGGGGRFLNNPHTTTDELSGIVAPATVVEGMYDVVTAYDGINSMFGYTPTSSVLHEYKFLSAKMQLAWLASKEDDGADGNLKPLTGTDIGKQIRQMEEYAGVAIFSDYSLQSGTVNLVAELARKARESEARVLAELTIGTIESAIETRVAGATVDGFVVAADAAGSVANALTAATEKEKAQSLVDYVNTNNGDLVNGVMIMSKHSAGTLRVQLGLTANQALDRGELGEDPVLSRIFGHTVITVPNDLMPLINSGATTTVGTPTGNVTVDHSVFFLERENWDGKQFMGGSQFDSSDTAAYEIGGNTKSAFMRDETVVRVYGYAAAHVKDFRYVTGLQANV